MNRAIEVRIKVEIQTNKGPVTDEFALAEGETIEELFQRAQMVAELRVEQLS